jgi:cytochrome c peroxidase
MFSLFRSKPPDFSGNPPVVARGLVFVVIGLIILLATIGAIATAGEGGGQEATIAPLETIVTDGDKTALGARLFVDTRLSRDGTKSCNTCHDLNRGGINPSIRPSVTGPHAGFDTLSIFNAALNYRFGWLADHRTLEEINEESILDADVMGSDWATVLHRLREDREFDAAFQTSFGSEWGRQAVLDVLGEFQRSLITPNSRFDRYLAGKKDAITPAEEQGYRLFQGYGCISCHQGRNIGGNLVQKFGVFSGPEGNGRPQLSEADLGRFAVSGLELDRHVFRVPSLRNVAVTGPYLHNGSVSTLAEVIAIMGRTQLGREISQADIASIVAFLGSLTGEYQGKPLGPKLPDPTR